MVAQLMEMVMDLLDQDQGDLAEVVQVEMVLAPLTEQQD